MCGVDGSSYVIITVWSTTTTRPNDKMTMAGGGEGGGGRRGQGLDCSWSATWEGGQALCLYVCVCVVWMVSE